MGRNLHQIQRKKSIAYHQHVAYCATCSIHILFAMKVAAGLPLYPARNEPAWYQGAFQTCTVPSPLTEAMRAPSGDHATALTSKEWCR